MQKNIYMKCLLKRILNYNELVERKGKMADALVDGKLNIDKGAMLDFLLS